MIPAITPLTRFPLAWIPPGWDRGITDPFAALLADGDADLTCVLIATPFDPAARATTVGLPAPLGRTPFGTGPAVRYTGTEVPVYLSDRGYLSAGTDTPAHQSFPAALETAYTVTTRLGGASDPLAPIADTSLSDITIRNTGTYDALTGYSWAGRSVEIRAGIDAWPLIDFATILRGTAAGIRWDEERLHIALRTRIHALEQQVDRLRFAGTGGIEGPPSLAGQPVPIVAGRRRQIPMVQLDAALQIWRAAERLSAVMAVRDLGLSSFTGGVDYPNAAALAAAALTPGSYATCLALGLFRFGSQVTLPTADVDGDPDAGDTAASILRWLVTTKLSRLVRLALADVDGAGLNALDAERPWRTSVYIGGDETMAGPVGRVLRSVAAWAATTRTGLLTVGLYRMPTDPDVTIGPAQIDDAGLPSPTTLAPVRRLVVGWRPMTRVLSETEMPAAGATDKALLGRAYREVESSWATPDRGALDAVIPTDLDEQADAQALAGVLASYLGACTRSWTVPLRGLPYRYRVGQVVLLQYPRFGLDAGVPCLVVGMEESSDGRSSLELRGPPPTVDASIGDQALLIDEDGALLADDDGAILVTEQVYVF